MFSGCCDNWKFVSTTWDNQMHGSCRDCHFRESTDDGLECQVLQGLEPSLQCPELQELVRYEGIMIYSDKTGNFAKDR